MHEINIATSQSEPISTKEPEKDTLTTDDCTSAEYVVRTESGEIIGEVEDVEFGNVVKTAKEMYGSAKDTNDDDVDFVQEGTLYVGIE